MSHLCCSLKKLRFKSRNCCLVGDHPQEEVSRIHVCRQILFCTLPNKCMVASGTINVIISSTFSQTSPCFQNMSFENILGKGEIAHNEQFLLFPLVFSTHLENILLFSSNQKSLSANSFKLEDSKICRLGKS